ncbi:MAG: hypothetical protein ACK4EY_16200 [Flavipsychrobacter sp.]
MKRIALLVAVAEYFNSYTTSAECFATADNQLFHDKHNAVAHGRDTLRDETVEHFERLKLESYAEELAKLQASEGGEGDAPKAVDYSKWKKAELEAELTKREIAFEPTQTNAEKAAMLKAADEAAAGK